MQKISLFLLFILLFTSTVFSGDKPRTAVIPFTAIGVAEMESLTASTLFETALVQTESFLVIEQNQIAEILDAQSYTLSGCTDESCAVEIGKLLAAEQIILGSFSKVGSGYIINAKIIDVTLGRNIRAAKVEFSTMDDLSKSMDLLAYKLAGLTFKEGGAETIATAFGELFVSTDPASADIFVNGVKKGQSPDVVSRIPLGKVLVEARHGNLYGSKEVEVGTDMGKIDLVLKIVLGNLFIKSSEKQVNVFLDGKDFGPLGSGLFENLAVGLHKLELKGVGLYFKEDIELLDGTTVKIEAYPRKVGILEYTLPKNVTAVVTGRGGFTKTLSGRSRLDNIPTGTYTIKVKGADYNTLEEKIVIKQNEKKSYQPKLDFSEEYLEKQRSVKKSSFVLKLNELNEKLASTAPEDTTWFIEKVDKLLRDIDESGFAFPAIKTKIMELRLEAQKQEKDYAIHKKKQELKDELSYLKERYEKEGAAVSKRNIFKYVFSGLALGSFGGSGVSWYLGNEAYSNYTNALTTTETEKYRDQSKTWDAVKISTGTAGVVFTVLSLFNWFAEDKRPELNSKIAALSAQIAELEAK